MKNKIHFEVTEFSTIKEIIYNSAKVYGDNIAFTLKNKENDKVSYRDINYKEFLEDINSLGTEFYSLGLKGKRVAIMGKNRYEWVLTHFANLLGGIVSVPLDKDLKLEELTNSLRKSKADAIVFDPKVLELIEEVKKENLENLKEFICMDNIEGYKNIKELTEAGRTKLKAGKNEYVDYKIDENAMNILLFTSGTTSQAKAVMLSQKNIASNIYALQCTEDIRPTDTNIAFLPLHHIFGSTCMVLMLADGVRNTFPDGLRYIKQNLKEYKVTVFVGVPILLESIYKAIMREIDKQGKSKTIKNAIKISNCLLKFHIDIRRKLFKPILDALGGELRMIVSGGAAADPLYLKGFTDLGITTVQGYGLSETSPVIAGENFKAMKKGSVGFPMINDKIEIVDKDEKGIGEVRVKGPNIMLGYYEMPELTAEVLKDGWFYTGDLGYFDKDGMLFLTGRIKNMLVLRNGKKVFPEEIETIVNRIDLVQECMVFGLEDKKDNDIIVSVKAVFDKEIIKEKYADKTDEELEKILWDKIREINTTFPRYKHIQKLITTYDELIKTTTKKVKRQEEMKLIHAELAKK